MAAVISMPSAPHSLTPAADPAASWRSPS
jgi:hypothetical protein